MKWLREALTLREALARAEARPSNVQIALARAVGRSREQASVAENLWLAGAPAAIEAARESLMAALEAARLLASAEDEAGALRTLGFKVEDVEHVVAARRAGTLRELLVAARRVRRTIGTAHLNVAQLHRRRRIHWAVLVGVFVLAVVAAVRDTRRRMQLASAPWSVSYWDNPDFEGSPTTRVGWLAPSHKWRDGGPFGERDAFSLRLRTCLRLAAPATVGVLLRSDDGSRAYLDGQLLVDNWGDHGPREARGERALHAGAHLVQVDYYERGGGAELSVDLEVEGAYELSPAVDGCD